jgi:hypothetical protein
MTTLLLACGCEVRFIDGQAPSCPTHGNQAVRRVFGMPKPRFRGMAKGPLVEMQDLAPFVGRLVTTDQKEP